MANLTKAKRAQTLAKWKAAPPARIEKPLQYLRNQFPPAELQEGFFKEHLRVAQARRAASGEPWTRALRSSDGAV